MAPRDGCRTESRTADHVGRHGAGAEGKTRTGVRVFPPGGAEGTRTPDPHTASAAQVRPSGPVAVRYCRQAAAPTR